MTEHRTYCRICPVVCGLVVETDGDRVVKVRGDRDHPITHGYCCPKGRALPEFHHHPHRLDQPRLRGEVVTWDALIDDLAATVARTVGESGPDAFGVYYGTWSWVDALGRTRAQALARHLGSASVFSATTVDAIARLVVSELMGGTPALLPTIDTDAPGLTVLIGTNPVVSHGHAGAIADPITTLRSIAAGPGLWVVDPRRTETARLASRHLAVRPGSDAALLAFLVRAILADGADTEYLGRHADGVAELRDAVASWDADRAAARTGLPADLLHELVSEIQRAGHLTVVTGTGSTMSATGNITEWLAWALQIVTGSFEQPGGAWFNPGMFGRQDEVDHVAVPPDAPIPPGPPSRPDLPARFGERPCAALADEIESGRIRTLLVIGGNPLRSLPDTERLAAAFARLDALIVADVIESDTVALATHVLPVAGQLEREDVTWFTDRFPPIISAQRTAAVVEPAAERRPLIDVLQDLGVRLGLARDPDPMARYVARVPALAEPGVVVRDPMRVRGWVHDRLLPNGRWRAAPAQLLAQFEEWSGGDGDSLVMIPRRALRRMNSVLRDVGRPDDERIWIHPADAPGIVDGDLIHVQSATGVVVGHTHITTDITVGAVSISHGLAEVNVSVLTTGAPGHTDPLSGMPVQSGVPVTVTAMP